MLAAELQPLFASENEPRRPFAEWAEVPREGQLVWGTLYEQSEAYHVWQQGNHRSDITVHVPEGESYGIDIRQGYFTLDYGIGDNWAADFNFGGTTVGYRSFNSSSNIVKTTGISDSTFGLRYQIWHDGDTNNPYLPTLTFRAGAIIPGSYDRHIAFAPGNHGAAIEPSILFRKHLGWEGLGVWGDALYRWEHTTGNDQYIASIGLYQQIKGWELDVGYRHMQAISGSDVVLIGSGPPYSGIVYQTDVREINDAIDAGFSYTTKKQLRIGFHARKIFDGSNTDSKLWLGAFIDIPFDIYTRKK
jgi:hypothetical protein